MKINKTTAWACASGSVIMPWTIRSTRKEVVGEMERAFGRTWFQLRREGNSVVKVSVIPAET